jgi:hypothetical protein
MSNSNFVYKFSICCIGTGFLMLFSPFPILGLSVFALGQLIVGVTFSMHALR